MQNFSQKYFSSTLSYRHSFNGMEKDDEITGSESHLNFGARIYDSRVGRWLSRDKYDHKYPECSPYSFAINNPIIIIDIGGDSIWVTTYDITNADGTITQVNTIHTTVAVYNQSNSIHDNDMSNFDVDQLETQLEQELSLSAPENRTVNGKKMVYVADVNIRIVDCMADVDPTDHLFVIVDKVEDPDESGNVGGITTPNTSQVGYIEAADFNVMMRVMIHEWGHFAMLGHDEDGTNWMNIYVPRREGHFTHTQLRIICIAYEEGLLNQGQNYTIAEETTLNAAKQRTTENRPMRDNVSKGDKIPIPVTLNK